MVDLKQLPKDAMTGTFTREYMFPTLKRMIFDAKVHRKSLSILLVDIDHFKEVNDKYGHLCGDELLKYISSTLRSTLEDKGAIFRYGGDEFVVIFFIPDAKEAFFLARQFNVVIRKRPFLFNRRLFKMTVSCGLATYPQDAQEAQELLKVADEALYFSKKFGRNTTTQASKIKLQKIKMVTAVILELLFIGALTFYLNTYLKSAPVKALSRLSIRRLIPVGLKANATVALKNGNIIKGFIVAEEQNRLVLEKPLEEGSYKVYIKKNQIQSILIIP